MIFFAAKRLNSVLIISTFLVACSLFGPMLDGKHILRAEEVGGLSQLVPNDRPLNGDIIKRYKQALKAEGILSIEVSEAIDEQLIAHLRKATKTPDGQALNWAGANKTILEALFSKRLKDELALLEQPTRLRELAYSNSGLLERDFPAIVTAMPKEDWNPASRLLFLKFVLTGATPVVWNGEVNYMNVAMYNPVLDVVLMTKWERLEQFRLKNLISAFFILPEQITGDNLQSVEPRWLMVAGAEPGVAITKSIDALLKRRSSSAADFENLFFQKPKEERDAAFSRLAFGIVPMLKDKVCGLRFMKEGLKIADIVDTATKTDLQNNLPAEVFPQIGYLNGDEGLFVFSVRNNANGFIMGEAKEANGACLSTVMVGFDARIKDNAILQ